jgi:hypothetical protein
LSDTDEDNNYSQLSLETLSGQVSNLEGPDFWSSHLHPISITQFSEETGPCHNLSPADNLLDYFHLMVSEDFFLENVAT